MFDSADDALQAARGMQAATAAANPGRSAEEHISVCIGLGFGELLRVDADAWGSEVNTASRLGEDIAEGGEILATAGFRSAVPHARFLPHGMVFGTRPVYRWVDDGPVQRGSRR